MRLLILAILKRNNHHDVSGLDIMDRDMIRDNVEPYSTDIWRWGIENALGRFRKIDPTVANINLLNHDEASVTPQGIHFMGQYYLSERAELEQWFENARKHRRKAPIGYNPRSLDIIYLRLNGGREIEPCISTSALLGHSPDVADAAEQDDESYDIARPFRKNGIYEIEDYLAYKTAQKRVRRTRKQKANLDFNAEAKKLVETATAQTEQALARAGQSDSARLSNIRAHRRQVANAENAQRVAKLPSRDLPGSPGLPEPKLEPSDTTQANITPTEMWRSKNAEMLRQLQKQRWQDSEREVVD
jgi:hypothetical protein